MVQTKLIELLKGGWEEKTPNRSQERPVQTCLVCGKLHEGACFVWGLFMCPATGLVFNADLVGEEVGITGRRPGQRGRRPALDWALMRPLEPSRHW